MLLVDFGGRGQHRFSPYAWRSKIALAHLGLMYETREITFLDKSALAGITDYSRAPVLITDTDVITDSWNIALYLHQAYPHPTPLFADAGQMGYAAFLNEWVPRVLYPIILPMIAKDVVTKVLPEEQNHYRTTREAVLGCSLEQAAENREALVQDLYAAMEPLRATLARTPFLNGDASGYCDYIVGALFLWVCGTSPFQLLGTDDPMHLWRARLFERYRDIITATDGYDW
ncbi:glutathione S-transferase N-terminal domain-containing protein [uncultured Ruegeria sp.]|uniref:glutathione S-transferase N-terminal domain-containing protein n=1 Tax=uncultured Ruegeria sp. TaxID=259304 RepID=UPI00260DB1AA|nr:glutathione S-transferase N-terminal domain-containing protein [uncultured Ruegeria sp.]